MKVLVLGAGVVGVTAAYYLARAGHEVTVIERRPGPGLETSFANGGQVVPSHAEPWAGPGTPRDILRWLGRADAPLLFRLKADPRFWAWGLRFLRNCTAARARRNTEANLRLGLYSLAALRELRAETGLRYDEAAGGSLHLFRDAAAFEAAARHAEEMTALGCPQEAVDRRRCVEIEPALAPTSERLAGGIHCPVDEIGDAFKFTQGLARLAEGLGVRFRYGVTLKGLERAGGAVAAAVTDAGRLAADAYVLALGSYSAPAARRIGLRLPVYPVKGYSLTAPITEPRRAPAIGLSDAERRVVLVPLGTRLRVAGTAEIAGYDTRPDPARSAAVLAAAREILPQAADYARAEPWCGLRPVTPDGVPMLGRTRLANLFLDTGHGTLGWTHACGSGRVVADLVSGRAPGIDLTGLTLERF